MRLSRPFGVYVLLLATTLGLGLASRRFAGWLPLVVARYAGDTLWALLVFWLTGLVRPRWSSWQAGAAAFGLAVSIEISQLWHPTWLQAIRATTLGALALGHGFLWSDLLCYAAGVLTGMAGELAAHAWFRSRAAGNTQLR
ncbi:ribosomal maturation YjgA family protein [Hymenobacter metallilatus]|uniref:DUF2809 domain-containing protein n=1 Tax=Hymenobacter metallilatus TaxID=2493666 RepID=A0A3R9UHS7_9BACT|nr:DUF2809 domain-containing protein [Hymenobacter metallilatus]RSK31801.1 DUF2809 domain-containing protein [Hymenobacter metallilatus]